VTLVIALRSPDWIVLAGDTLTTIAGWREFDSEADVTCPGCSTRIGVRLKNQKDQAFASTLPHAQKVFPFLGRYGVGKYNESRLAGQNVRFAMRLLEGELREEGWKAESVRAVAEKIGERVHALAKRRMPDLAQAADEQPTIGSTVSG
jgi:hypothetical protein